LYTAKVADANGCISTVTTTINEPSLFVAKIASVTDNQCFGEKNGAVKIDVTGGNLPYKFRWSNGDTTQTNSQIVRDLRNLRDAAFTLWSYGRHDDCERLLGNIRELLAGPPMGNLGDNDEEAADKQIAAREPKVQRGAEQGRRGRKDAKPLMRIDELAPGLRADQIIGMEVRSSDDKIVGEVRNIVFGTKDRRDYAIVASGGFFTPGKDSIVVPIQSLKVSQERVSFFLPISKETMTKVPLMPDQDYKWLLDKKWRAHNDAIFRGK
jgi:sporulation protein YlmC with PRC-barrel domain